MVESNEIDLEKKYGFKIFYRDVVIHSYINPFARYIVYFIIQDNELYYLTTNKEVTYLDGGGVEVYGLDPLSGHGVDYLEKDYQIVYHDERDKCIFTEELFKKFCVVDNFSENTEAKLKRFYRKRKIDNYFKNK